MQSRDTASLESLRNIAQALRSLVTYLVENNLDEVEINPKNGSQNPVKVIAEKHGIALDVLIDESVKRGLLKPYPVDMLVFCPKCGSSTFRLRLKCPNCGSLNVTRNTLFSHVTCGYIGVLEEAPRDSRGRIFCPKCKQELLKEGQDWVKIGVNWRCRDCGTTFAYPKPLLECVACGAKADENKLEYRQVYRYKFDKKIASDLYAQTFSKRVGEVLAAYGWTVTPVSEIKGVSGIPKNATLLAERKGEKMLVYNIFPREGNVEEARREVLNALGAALDGAFNHLILGVKTPTQVAKMPENVSSIEGGTLEEVIEKLRDKLAKEKR